MNGFELVQSMSSKPEIIFITSKPEYAVQAFEENVADYLVKPVNFTRFQQAVNRARDRHAQQPTEVQSSTTELFIKEGIDLFRVSAKDINYIKAEGDYVCLHTDTKRHMILMSMKKLEDKLPPNQFSRVHRSYIVRTDKVDCISDYVLTIGETIIPISKSYKPQLIKGLNLL